MALTWDDFDVALTDVLGRLEDGSRVIVYSFDEEDYYVQCASDAGLPLTLEAVSDDYLADPVKRGADGAAAMTALGWQPPRETPGNWWVDLAWPATSAQLAAGARLMTAALRDVFGVSEPTRLLSRAWRDSGSEDLEFAGLGIEQV